MIAVLHAWNILSDPVRRSEYDTQYHSGANARTNDQSAGASKPDAAGVNTEANAQSAHSNGYHATWAEFHKWLDSSTKECSSVPFKAKFREVFGMKLPFPDVGDSALGKSLVTFGSSIGLALALETVEMSVRTKNWLPAFRWVIGGYFFGAWLGYPIYWYVANMRHENEIHYFRPFRVVCGLLETRPWVAALIPIVAFLIYVIW